MRKIISINISSASFFIDEDAYDHLSEYLDKLKNRFVGEAEGNEIIADIETRLSELFAERINPKTGVITLAMVEEVIQIMGQPEDFSDIENDAKAASETYDNSEPETTSRRLYRDIESNILGGVCAGIGAYLSIDPVVVRIVFIIFLFLGLGTAIPVYIVLWIVMPAAVTTTQKMEMRGENITVQNIEKKIKEECEDVKERFENFKRTNKTYRKGEDYVKRMNSRDRTILIIAAIVILLLIAANLTKIFAASLHVPVLLSG
ncbi:MAG: PspC domain-containing protein [Cytophagaceae bacterium]|jgi:phage shock protein PspC (stress-responsive transcriptional regulator)|nr:PspC domain-containing protein [Cytophagaceae bacterium]